MHSSRISITLPPPVLKKIDAAAEALSMNRSAFIAAVMQDHLAQGDAMINALGDDRIRNAFHQAFTRPGVLQALVSEMGQELTKSQRQEFLRFLKPDRSGSRPR